MAKWEDINMTMKLKGYRPRKKRVQHRKRIKGMRDIQLGITIGSVVERTLNKFFTHRLF